MNDECWTENTLLAPRSSLLAPLFQLASQFPEREKAAVTGIDFIRHRTLQDDFGSGFVSDFHQSRNQRKVLA